MTGRVMQFRTLFKELRIANEREFYEQRCREYEEANRQAVLVRNAMLLPCRAGRPRAAAGAGTGRVLCSAWPPHCWRRWRVR
jgi:hypothetical protein